MRLTKIKLSGFKSFVDPTTIHLPSDLVGIVGPNGCGKSNVIDAVRWVMGESSAKHLRGDSMADVIFNGSNARKPVGHASVELVFDNSDGSVGGQYAQYNEISVRRQVSRDGQSVYFLNATRCRRRDITDIFLGTGLGPRSYSIIEQGMISRLIEAKPEELRIFLEEAAGISKYKERRRETENRIRHTRENLSRLEDLQEEIEKQLEKLQRQARTAERYKALKEEERRARAELLALRYQSQHEEAARRQRAIQERETALEGVVAEQRAIEASMEKRREALAQANDAFNEVQARYYGLGAEIARLEQAIQNAKETRQRREQELTQVEEAWREAQAHIEVDLGRLEELSAELTESEPQLEALREREQASAATLAEAEQAVQDWQAEWEDFNRRAAEPAQTAQVERTRIDHLDRQLAQLAERLERIEQELGNLSVTGLEEEIRRLGEEEAAQREVAEQAQGELDSALARIRDQRELIEGRSGELDEVRSRQQHLRGRLASLEALQQAALGQGAGAVTQWLDSQGLAQAPRLAQQLHVEPGWERAVETVLGFYLEAVCTDGLDGVTEALGSLEHGALALVDTRVPAAAVPPDGLVPPLLGKVRATSPVGGLDSLMGGVYAARDLTEALALRGHLQARESVVTPEGVWMGRGWLRLARDADEKAGVLERENEIKELNEQLNEQSELSEALEAGLEEARADLRDAEHSREELQVQVNQAHRQRSEIQAQLNTRKSRLEHARARSEALTREAEELRAGDVRDRDELAAARRRLHEALESMEVLAEEREQRSARRDDLRQAQDDARARAREDREAAQALTIRIESMRTARTSTEQALERMRSQQGHLVQRREALTEALEAAEAPLQTQEEELSGMLNRRMSVEHELGEARRAVEDIEHALRSEEQERTARERRAQELRDSLAQERMAWQEIQVRSETLLEQLAETGLELQTLTDEMPEEAEVGVWQERVEQLEQRIQRLGPINLAAIEEFKEQSERKTYLDAQHGDLTEALETLENAIRRIDRETRTRFKETFDKVNHGLQQMFPRLFGGGHAYLELTGEDLLDTGVAVMARPPGKRNSTIHLLSGGEKALTAVALVFAIFELNPSPFCMLDEVDAPLDDANVGRFCDMVREMSERVQFIFITHNKITMELSHHLTGVTMHEPGVSRLVAVDVDEAVQMAAV